jgi:hypothetical protein
MGEFRFNPEAFSDEEESPELEPSISSPERKKIKPELTIVVPKNFELNEEGLKDALEDIVSQHRRGSSVQELRDRGLEYTGKKVYPIPIEIMPHEIVGAENPNGWAGLITGIGPEDKYAKPQALSTLLNHAQQIIAMEKDERNRILHGIDLVSHGRDFFVDSDGRHRMFTLKALQKLGCYVSISGVKVGELL